jgi:hypothetical protein
MNINTDSGGDLMDRPKTSSSVANFKRRGNVKIKKSALARVQSASTLDTAK